MSTRLHDDKSLLQIRLRIGLQYSFEFLMDRMDKRRLATQITHPDTHVVDKDETAKISISCDEYPPLFLSDEKEFFIGCSCTSDVSGSNDIVV
ncbi:MAG: hypothetical protein ETSY2_10810 [Candidatus Entotheonella gemina]|uniref:Uncharacterized protein n=1 Tax=Candidatus Entotheonella gemina TaxID=1429439 RepID=W4MC53_9BACT|nr:MAG: hypothetical protein ETSY2_10810 [Candidatus Entotheonella gemina]